MKFAENCQILTKIQIISVKNLYKIFGYCSQIYLTFQFKKYNLYIIHYGFLYIKVIILVSQIFQELFSLQKVINEKHVGVIKI